MEDLIIEGTQGTPEVNFNGTTGLLIISGRANANGLTFFYKAIDEWQDKYLTNPAELTTVELRLEYTNSVFLKLLYTFLDKCKSVEEKGKKLIIKWYHLKGDEDSIDDAIRFSKVIKFPIENLEVD